MDKNELVRCIGALGALIIGYAADINMLVILIIAWLILKR